MKKLFVIGFLVVALVGQAQITRGVKGGYNTENYPEISFIWNTADPNPMEKSQFILMENDQPVSFSFSQVNNNRSRATNKKSILILWEDMKSHNSQTDNTRELLLRFFEETELGRNDRFNVAVFNRLNPGENVLRPLLPEFVQDNDRLLRVVADYRKSTQEFAQYPKQSDLYQAINEGINLLKREPADRVGVIVVVTAGLNVRAAGATTEMETVRQSANEAGIPIYVVKYPIEGNTPEVNTLAENTYGRTIMFHRDRVDDALSDVRNMYNDLDNRCYGRDYRFTFTTSAERDGKTHPLLLTVNRSQQQLPPFTAPEMTFRLWIQEHMALFIVLVVLAIGLIVTIILLIVGSNRRRREREAANEAKIQQELAATRQEKQQWMMQQQAKEARQQAAADEQRRLEEEARMHQLMQTKNMFPRLQCSLAGKAFNYTIQQPLVKIGRASDNDLVLDHQTVSKHHAEICFTGAAFEVVNKSATYKQGIIVNGQFFQKTTLKSGDIIGLGEAVITFYL